MPCCRSLFDKAIVIEKTSVVGTHWNCLYGCRVSTICWYELNIDSILSICWVSMIFGMIATLTKFWVYVGYQWYLAWLPPWLNSEYMLGINDIWHASFNSVYVLGINDLLTWTAESLSLLYLLFISWFICSRRWCMGKLGAFLHVSWSISELRVRLASWNRFKPYSKILLLTVQRRYFFCGSFYVLCLSYVRVCSLLPCGHLLGKGWPLGPRLWCSNTVSWLRCCLIVSIPDLCHLSLLTVNVKLNSACGACHHSWTEYIMVTPRNALAFVIIRQNKRQAPATNRPMKC